MRQTFRTSRCCLGVLAAALVLVLTTTNAPASAATLPSYQNTVRVWGSVTDVQSTTIPPGGPFVVFFALEVPETTGNVFVRVDCGPALSSSIGCDQVAVGDSILVSGHLDDRVSCHHTGVDNTIHPNVLWKCNTGTCVQLTP